jgi:hypothetical protein
MQLENIPPEKGERDRIVEKIMADFEGEKNLTGLYDLLLKIDRRINPHLYTGGEKSRT